jgi:energy-coupling factor transporter transmembrane protein EcfT
VNPFAFDAPDSPLAHASAASKAFFLVCLSTAGMSLGFLPLSLLLAGGVFLMTSMRLPFRGMGKPALAIAWLLAFSALVRGIWPGDGRIFAIETLPRSGLYALRLSVVFIFARIYYVSTKASELGDILSVAARKAGVLADPGMMLSLSLLFLPRVFENYRKVREAAELRGYGVAGRRMKSLLPMLHTYMFTSIKGALTTARAMEARGYSEARTIQLRGVSWKDAVIAAAGCLLLALSFLLI